MDLLSFILVVGSERHVRNVTERIMALQGQLYSGSTKVVDFGTNEKHVCDFLMMINIVIRNMVCELWSSGK